MEELNEEKGLSLADLFHMLKKHIVGIIVAIIVCLGLGAGYALFLNPVSYKASTNVYVLYDNGSGNNSAESINYGRLAPKTFAEALTKDENIWKKIEEKAKANNELTSEKIEVPSYKVIGQGMSASYDTDLESLSFSFSYTSSNSYEVAPIMNATLDVLKDITNNTSEKDAFNFFTLSYLGEIEDEDIITVSTSKMKILLLAGIVGVVLGIGYAFIYELVDQKVTSKKTVEEICDLKIVGLIPDLAEFNKKGGKR